MYISAQRTKRGRALLEAVNALHFFASTRLIVIYHGVSGRLCSRLFKHYGLAESVPTTFTANASPASDVFHASFGYDANEFTDLELTCCLP